MFKNKYCKHLLTAVLVVLFILSFSFSCFASATQTIRFVDSYSTFFCIGGGAYYKIEVSKSYREFNGRGASCFTFPAAEHDMQKLITFQPAVSLTTNTAYKGSFSICNDFDLDCSLAVIVVFLDENDDAFEQLTLFEGAFSNSYLDIPFNFSVGNYGKSFTAVIELLIICDDYVALIPQTIALTDMSLSVDSPLYGDHFTPPDNNVGTIITDLGGVINNLPPPMVDEASDLFQFDFNGLAVGFSTFSNVFSLFLYGLGIGPLVLFSLAVGLAVYILGKRLENA